MTVFLDAERCKKITPYIPADLLKDWEWWYRNDRVLHKSVMKAVNGDIVLYIDTKTGGTHNANDVISKIKETVPALDTGILGSVILLIISKQETRALSSRRVIGAYGHPLLNKEVWLRFLGKPHIDQQVFDGKSELENRANALIYLIDNKIITEVNNARIQVL
jgi:hypothetical protein